jgi:hypothetical protein
MKLRNRFLLVGFGVIAFLVVTPFIVLYARGFKIDWQNRSFVKTGAMVVRTEPEKAQIYLNDELSTSVTPTNLRFLLPGDYSIRLEKENYQSWTKRLSVRSQIVTWANSDRDFITMFLKNPIVENNWTGSSVTVNDNEITFLENNQPTRIDVENGSSDTISSLPTPPVEDTVQQISDILTSVNIPVPTFTSGEIIRAENQIYLILDQNLYLVNDHLEKIYGPVNFAHWNSQSKQLLYANDNEIYIYIADWKTSDLILRSITPVKNPILNIETGFVFFQNENKIKTIELDGRDHRNIFTLTDALNNFSLSEDGKSLFVFNDSDIKQYTIR